MISVFEIASGVFLGLIAFVILTVVGEPLLKKAKKKVDSLHAELKRKKEIKEKVLELMHLATRLRSEEKRNSIIEYLRDKRSTPRTFDDVDRCRTRINQLLSEQDRKEKQA